MYPSPNPSRKGRGIILLGIETSCDETAVGIVDDNRNILANRIASQFSEHAAYGGVVPEIAARAHLDKIDELVRGALQDANLTLNDLSGIVATCGPGLIGGVMVGAMTAKSYCAVTGKPFIAVNHLAAHALTARLTDDVAFPYLLLLVSGGHSQLVLVRGVNDYVPLGTTIDDAVGECFDKSAKLLGLGQPGGPLLEKAAQGGNPQAFDLPRPMLGRPGCDMSFSGLKTAIRLVVEKQSPLSEQTRRDLAASIQHTIAEILRDRVGNALAMLGSYTSIVTPAPAFARAGSAGVPSDEPNNFSARDARMRGHDGPTLLNAGSEKITALVAAGGVAANGAIRAVLTQLAAQHALPFVAPPPKLCTDNGVMVAWAGLERLRLNLTDPLDTASRPRWPLGASG